MREHRGPALREVATDRYGKEPRINQDKESSKPDADRELIGFVLNSTKFGTLKKKEVCRTP